MDAAEIIVGKVQGTSRFQVRQLAIGTRAPAWGGRSNLPRPVLCAEGFNFRSPSWALPPAITFVWLGTGHSRLKDSGIELVSGNQVYLSPRLPVFVLQQLSHRALGTRRTAATSRTIHCRLHVR